MRRDKVVQLPISTCVSGIEIGRLGDSVDMTQNQKKSDTFIAAATLRALARL